MGAAIYCRISKDRTGAGLGVERQEEDCRALAASLGLQVADVFVDNDLSAYSGKPRPEYDRMLAGLKAGRFDAVIVWHQDRLLRRNVDLEGYIAVCEPKGVPTYTVRAGTVDLATPSGRAVARTLAAWASYEVETSTVRVKAAKLQAARSGKFSGGQRPYGYEPACTAIREEEAAVVRELADRVIRGESFRSLAIDLNERGITTTHGKQWSALKVRNLLSHKRYAGIREHHDAEYAAAWPAILDRETWDQLQAAIRANANLYSQRGPGRKYLLTGFVYCGNCGQRMHTKPRAERGSSTRYVCTNRPKEGFHGCGKVSRNIAPVDYLVTEAIIYRLDSPELAKKLNGNDEEKARRLAELLEQHRQQSERVAMIDDMFATGEMNRQSYTRAITTARAKLEAIDKEMQTLQTSTAARRLLSAGPKVREAWDSSDIEWRRRIVGLLVEKVVIHPSDITGMTKAQRWNGWVFKPQDVEIRWSA
jgi:site-specific DNA recombinase